PAPVVDVGDDHRIGAGERMVVALVAVLPLVAGAHQAPVAFAARLGALGALRLRGQFLGGEVAAQPAVVGDLHRLVEALDPYRIDPLDGGPRADGFDVDALM